MVDAVIILHVLRLQSRAMLPRLASPSVVKLATIHCKWQYVIGAEDAIKEREKKEIKGKEHCHLHRCRIKLRRIKKKRRLPRVRFMWLPPSGPQLQLRGPDPPTTTDR